MSRFFALITVMIFLSKTFAPWNENFVYSPPSGTTINCKSWIINSGFKELDINENMLLTKAREPFFDYAVPIWAVLYAHILSAFPYILINRTEKATTAAERVKAPLTPLHYCNDQNLIDEKNLIFEKYENFQRTCKEWFQLYMFNIKDPKKDNWNFIKYRHTSEDGKISLILAVYAYFISHFTIKDIIPVTAYCRFMFNENEKMLFMSLDGTKMSCKRWIYLSGYTNDIQTNINKAKKDRILFEKYKRWINSWTVYYVDYLLLLADSTTYFGCSTSCGDDEFVPEKPAQFCRVRGYSKTTLLKYFDEKNE